ncbi:pantetheine-phosphate adenylyltransferase [Konateibacter massiliensis]|uniref:pantetheine-phosphate adenylyltransferase n=1 Tax=Konateibacter massiliensis TaxID=2002841 RepID=UPI000C15B53D|nr:pantetheine-phosphate adenylyltransferase [Konateibacter massiliensis]
MNRAIYPGSFDPVTYGHLDIIKRSADLFGELYVGVLNNTSKSPLFSVEERVNMLKEATADISNIKVVSYSGLLVDFVKEVEASVVVRGLRAITDFEYELQLAQTNHVLYPEADTMFLTARLEYSYLSSTTVREVASFGGDITKFVPKKVAEKMYEKYGIDKK